MGMPGGEEKTTGWLMIGEPPIVGGHPEGPQPAPQRPGTTANQVTAHNAPARSASLRMGELLFDAPWPKKWGSGRRAHEDIDFVGLSFRARCIMRVIATGDQKRRPTGLQGCVSLSERAEP